MVVLFLTKQWLFELCHNFLFNFSKNLIEFFAFIFNSPFYLVFLVI